jgi:hypothetical protein
MRRFLRRFFRQGTHVTVKPKIEPTVRNHAITREGVSVLIHASGPGTTWLERRRARRNLRRWNAARAHLLEG